jgi:hypothetical protein
MGWVVALYLSVGEGRTSRLCGCGRQSFCVLSLAVWLESCSGWWSLGEEVTFVVSSVRGGEAWVPSLAAWAVGGEVSIMVVVC